MSSNRYNISQAAIVDQDNRNMAGAGLAMSTEINSLWSAIDTGPIGIISDARDIDSLAKGGGAFTWDSDSTPGNSLSFAWKAGHVLLGTVVVNVAAGSLALAASVANYVEADAGGGVTVTANTAGFTAGRVPLYVITPGASTYSAGNIVLAKAMLVQHRPGSFTGTMLSTAAATKEAGSYLGAVPNSGAYTTTVKSPNAAATIAGIRLSSTTGVAQSDTNYWTMTAVNLGPSGSGSTALVAATPANTTKVTGGAAIVAGVPLALPLTGTSANLITAANDLILITLTPTGSPTALTGARLDVDWTFAG